MTYLKSIWNMENKLISMTYENIYHTRFALFFDVTEENIHQQLLKMNPFLIFTLENTTHFGIQTLFGSVVCCLSHVLSFSYSCVCPEEDDHLRGFPDCPAFSYSFREAQQQTVQSCKTTPASIFSLLFQSPVALLSMRSPHFSTLLLMVCQELCKPVEILMYFSTVLSVF